MGQFFGTTIANSAVVQKLLTLLSEKRNQSWGRDAKLGTSFSELRAGFRKRGKRPTWLRPILRTRHRPQHCLMTISRLAMQFLLCVIVALCFRTSADAAQLLTNLSDKSLAVAQGSSVTTTITADFRRYPTGFAVSGLPQGVSADFAPESCYRDCSTHLTSMLQRQPSLETTSLS